MESPRLEIRILGPLTVRVDGELVHTGGPKQRALLALLLLNANRVVSREQLNAELFADQSPGSAGHALHNHVSRLRKLLSPATADAPRLVARPPGYLLRVEPGELDLERFERLAADGREALAGGDAATAAASLRAAEELWIGRPLADIELDGLARVETERLEELRLAATELRIDAELALGRQLALVPELETLIADHPYREHFRGQLMLALYRSSRQAESLDLYRRTQRLLDDELGLEPSIELQQLERAILVQDAELSLAEDGRAPGPAVAVAPICPFKGLGTFDAADAPFFFGRERLIDELLPRLHEAQLLLISGPSGIGKSSLLRAGLLSRLTETPHVVMRPGDHPAAELARAVGGELPQALARLRPGERLLLAVDQLEEVFAPSVAEAERRAFIETLVEAAWDTDGRASVVLTLRADFWGRLAPYAEFAELAGANHVLLGPMTSGELRRAIEGPCERAALGVEEALVDALVEDVAGEVGGLPLLSTVLVDLYHDRQGGRLLTFASYERVGGVRGAVGRHAESAYRTLDDESRRVAKSIFLRLVTGGGEEGYARRRIMRAELDSEEDERVASVLATLVERRLLVADDGTVELVHEALIDQWPTLAGWLDEDVDGRRLHRNLTQAASEWQAAARDPSELYRGARLAAALEWVERAGDRSPLNQLEEEFLGASRAAATAEAERQRRANRRLRGLLVAALGLLLAVVAAGAVALVERGTARDHERAAIAQRLGVQAITEPRLDRSVLLARQGVALDDSRTTQSNLLEALLRSPAAIRVLPGTGSPLGALELTSDGRTLVAGDSRGIVRFLDAASGRPSGRRYTTLSGITALKLSPDGKVLAVVAGGFVDLVDARTHDYLRRLFPEPQPAVLPGTVAFSPDSRVLAADVIRTEPRLDAVVMRWDTRTGARLGPRFQVDREPDAALVGYIAGGARLVTSSSAQDATVIRDAATLQPVRRLRGGGARTALSPDGRIVALGGANGSVRLLDLRTGVLRVATDRHDAAVTDLRFTPDSRTLLTAGGDGRLVAWNVADARRIDTFAGHASAVSRVTIAPDGRTAFSAGQDATLIAWDLAGTRRLDRLFSAPPRGPQVFPAVVRGPRPTEFAPEGVSVPLAGLAVATTRDGRTFVVPDGAGYVDVFDGRTLARTRRLPIDPGRQVAAVALAADDRTVAAITSDGHLRFADLRSPRRLERLRHPYAHLAWTLAFSADGRWLAVGGGPLPTLRIWDVRRRTVVNTAFMPPFDIPADVAFSPDGRRLAVAAISPQRAGSAIQILSVPGLEVFRTLSAPAGRTVEFSPDGRLLVLGDEEGRVHLYDTRTWRLRGRPFVAHVGAVVTATVSPDGQTLATTSDDGTARLWDVSTGRPIGSTLPGPAQQPVAAAFVDGGTHLVTLSETGRGHLWDIRPESWARRACEVAGRTLTSREWQDALPDRSYAPACASR
jgi:WD40 repeat protein/DNA-binding SARP family transcriptional activator